MRLTWTHVRQHNYLLSAIDIVNVAIFVVGWCCRWSPWFQNNCSAVVVICKVVHIFYAATGLTNRFVKFHGINWSRDVLPWPCCVCRLWAACLSSSFGMYGSYLWNILCHTIQIVKPTAFLYTVLFRAYLPGTYSHITLNFTHCVDQCHRQGTEKHREWDSKFWLVGSGSARGQLTICIVRRCT